MAYFYLPYFFSIASHTDRFQAQTALAQEQERYIRLLEKDLEAVRNELRQVATTFVSLPSFLRAFSFIHLFILNK